MRKTKCCRLCKKTKHLNEFYLRKCLSGKNGSDGHRTECKECLRKKQREYAQKPQNKKNRAVYLARPEVKLRYRNGERKPKIRETRRRYRKSLQGKRVHRAAWHRWANTKTGKKTIARVRKRYKQDPIKQSAQYLVQQAIKHGKLIRPSVCSINNTECCGPIMGHHPDYSKPLEVIWLCAAHHQLLHQRENKNAKNT